MYYESLLNRITDMSRELLGENLVGVYLHGSLAMGCFNPKKSDLDLILLVEDDLSAEQKKAFIRSIVRFNEEAPEKGIELSIVKREFCKPFVYPTPYELHFSNAHLKLAQTDLDAYIEKLHGTDKDLAAHFTIINHYGVVLYGAPIESVFGDVPKADYIDSIWFDVENAAEDILENPMYITLNLCRVLAYLKEDLVLSKKAGGEWGTAALPEYVSLIGDALRCYETNEEMKIAPAQAVRFAQDMIGKIRVRMEAMNE